jgi:hypothetical protein
MGKAVSHVKQVGVEYVLAIFLQLAAMAWKLPNKSNPVG